MDTPIRKYQKQKDYQRHKLFRKMKRRRKAAIEQAKDAPMKPLRRKFKIPKFEGGKDDKPNVFQLADGTFVNSHNEPLDVLDYAGVEDPTKWTYVDKKGNRYTPKATRTLTEGEQFTQRQIENEQNTRPFEFTPYIEGANEGAAAASLMMGFPFNMAGSAYYTAKASRDAYNRNYLGGVLNGLGAVTPAGSGIYDRIKLAIENYRQPLKKLESPVIRTVQDNGKIRLSLPTHTDSNPRQFVLEPQGDNKFYVHMRTWDGDHVPANLSNEDKQTLFQALYDELPDGAEILFPKSGPGYYGTRGTVAGLQRLARDSRFTPGTKGTLQYLDKDGKTVKTYEGTSFIKTPRITAENAANITPETIRLYHGSPVRFNTFSANFIGSGEGGSKVMRGINLWPEEKIGNAPKLANIKSPDAPMHLGVSSTPLGGELNPTVYDVLGKDLNLYKAAPREVKSLKQEDLVKQGYDGVQTPNQVTVFPESIHKLSIDKQSSIEDFVMSHPEVEKWTPWTTDAQKMQNIIDMSKMPKWTPEQWTAAQDAAIAKGDMAEARRLRDLHFKTKAPNTKITDSVWHGSRAKNFNIFDLKYFGRTDGGVDGYGHYFGTKRHATGYKNPREFYLNMENPYTGNHAQFFNREEYFKDNELYERIPRKADAIRYKNGMEQYKQELLNKDGVIDTDPVWGDLGTVYLVPRSNQIKLADAVTYDDNGVRIPLGNRDNFNINDIRYGLLAPLAGGTALFGYNSLGQHADAYKHGKDESTQKMKRPVTTGGVGYIPDNYGQGVIDFVRRRLYDNILPWGYNDIPNRFYNAVIKNKKEEDKTRDKAIRDDLWATYLQIPKSARHVIEGGKVTLTDAIYTPKGSIKGKPTYRFSRLTSPAEYGILAYAGQVPGSLNVEGEDYLPIGKNRVIYPGDINAFSELEGLGQFTVGRGYDKKGEYISYYDSWDLGDTNSPYKDLSLGIGKPFNIYDRIYLDDYYGVKQPTHATYLPEVTVYGKKKKGSTFNKGKDSGIHINPKNRGKFNALKKRTGKTTEQLTHSKNPLTRKRAIFAQNAKKWKH